MLENFQENISSAVGYYLNFGMKAWNLTNLVLHEGCVPKNFLNFPYNTSEQLLLHFVKYMEVDTTPLNWLENFLLFFIFIFL